jgi:excisionase family DNA binding protein
MSAEPQQTGRMIVPGKPVLLSASDVALFMGISAKTVHKLVRERKLACVQVTSRERRFTHEQVEDYIRIQTSAVRVDKHDPRPVRSVPKKGGTKSSGVLCRQALLKEMRKCR